MKHSGPSFELEAADTQEVAHMAEQIKPFGLHLFLPGCINIEGHTLCFRLREKQG